MVWKPAAILAHASLAVLAAAGAAGEARAGSLRVCADPGNMPFSNNRGEGIENRIAAVLARNLGTWVQYYYRPGIERGMTRTTLYAEECDVMFDMPADSERVLLTTPLYRTTFVLASRSDRGITKRTSTTRGSRGSRSASTRLPRSAKRSRTMTYATSRFTTSATTRTWCRRISRPTRCRRWWMASLISPPCGDRSPGTTRR